MAGGGAPAVAAVGGGGSCIGRRLCRGSGVRLTSDWQAHWACWRWLRGHKRTKLARSEAKPSISLAQIVSSLPSRSNQVEPCLRPNPHRSMPLRRTAASCHLVQRAYNHPQLTTEWLHGYSCTRCWPGPWAPSASGGKVKQADGPVIRNGGQAGAVLPEPHTPHLVAVLADRLRGQGKGFADRLLGRSRYARPECEWRGR